MPASTASASSTSTSSSIGSIVSRAFTANSEWDEKDDFLDVVYWIRQVVGVIIGICFGVVGVKGAVGIAGFAAINAGVVYAYCSAFQSIDEEVSEYFLVSYFCTLPFGNSVELQAKATGCM